MKKILIFCPFEVKDKSLLTLEHHYLKQLKIFDLEIRECKSFGENQMRESQYLIKSLKEFDRQNIYLFREKGGLMNTMDFSKFIDKSIGSADHLIFVFSGAKGFSQEVLELFPHHLSLSKLTLPHKLARLVLVEQIYRSHSIITNHPYHN